MGSSLDLLFRAMDGLKPEQLKRFNAYLSDRDLDGFKPMPISCQGDTTDTVTAMRQFYGIEGALRITVHILKKIHCSDLADELEKGMKELPSQEEQATDAPQTDTVLPEPSHTKKRGFSKIQPQSSLSQPQPSTSDHISEGSGEFTDEPLNIKNFKCDDENARVTKDYIGGASAENKIESISDRAVVPEVFTPKCNPYNDRKSYRWFSCSTECLVQCRYTGLGFNMDKGGEVEYRTEPWNCPQLAKHKYVPAGSLFDIKCPQGTLSQIRFPHCEVFPGEERKRLSVIHISDAEEYEMLDPHETTDSYVVLNIRGCSKYGLAKRQPKQKYSPIKGLVLLFLQGSTLNVLLLPKNVDIYEVYEKRKRMKKATELIYIETNADCELVPEKKYCLSSDSEEYEVTPVSAKFREYENYRNYITTFQVFLTKPERVKLNLKAEGSDECVWSSNLKLPDNLVSGGPPVPSPSSPYTPPGQDFFHKHKEALETRLGLKSHGVLSTLEREEVQSKKTDQEQNEALLLMLKKKGVSPPLSPYIRSPDFFHRHKAKLEKRLGLLAPILSELVACRVLNSQDREVVESKESGSKQNRALLLTLEKKGGQAQEEFYKVLKICDEYLVMDLEIPYRTYET